MGENSWCRQRNRPIRLSIARVERRPFPTRIPATGYLSNPHPSGSGTSRRVQGRSRTPQCGKHNHLHQSSRRSGSRACPRRRHQSSPAHGQVRLPEKVRPSGRGSPGPACTNPDRRASEGPSGSQAICRTRHIIACEHAIPGSIPRPHAPARLSGAGHPGRRRRQPPNRIEGDLLRRGTPKRSNRLDAGTHA